MKTTIASPLTPFRAYVDPSLITSASSFFDNSIRSVLRELLQNSRRSGATRVDLNKSGQRWTYTDDGPGCLPQDLLGLGRSSWQEEVATRETPAGCGFFSLARRNPVVVCPKQGWRAVLREAHFNGSEIIEPEPYTPSPEDENVGIRLVFDRGDLYDVWGFDGIAEYMPFDFYMDGKKQACREDYLGKPSGSIAHKFVQINEFITIRVDLIKATSAQQTACYQGFTVDLCDRDYTSFGTVGATVSVRAAVMVERERALPLELPQRNKMVKSEFTAALKDRIYCTGLELAAEHLADTCLASPDRWLKARSRGYTGPVLYTKFIGQLITRHEAIEMADYTVSCDDCEVYDNERFVTIEEFENGDFRIAPAHDTLCYLAQTTIPTAPLDGGGVSYEIDLDEYFAPGLKLVHTLESLKGFGYGIKEGDEGYEWTTKLRKLIADRSSWSEYVSVVATGKLSDGSDLIHNEDIGRDLDCDNLYDSIVLEFESEDGDKMTFETGALFHLPGDSDNTDIDFIATREWFQKMPSDFANTVTGAVYKMRKCHERDHDEEVTFDSMQERLESKFAKFTGLDDFYKDRILTAADSAVESALQNLDWKPAKVVISFGVSPSSKYRHTIGGKVEFLPAFVPYYTFHGSHGTVTCDEQGRRDPDEEPEKETGKVAYPEFHSFDVDTMKQLGIAPGEYDILVSCGWHDSTKRVYLTPEIRHLLCCIGACEGPACDVTDEATVRGLAEAIKIGRISPTLYSAFWYESQDMVKKVVPLAMEDLPPISRLWTYSQNP